MKDIKIPSIEIIEALCMDSPKEAGVAVSDIVRMLNPRQVLEMFNAFNVISALLEDKLHESAITGTHQSTKQSFH